MNNRFKTLYVSDLDGTLLNKNEEISEYTSNIINNLVDKGMRFSYATARSYVTSSKVAKEITAKVPLIVYNGAFVIDNSTKKIMISNYFEENEIVTIKNAISANQIHPIVYSYINGIEKFSFQEQYINEGLNFFLTSRKNDVRENPVNQFEKLFIGDVFYVTCIDTKDNLFSAYNSLKENFNCLFHKDIYSGEHWLEIMPLNATKANAILQLKKHLDCDKIISFGDGKNDISMFDISDECYAVENAVEELKEIATGIIKSNDEDGVAQWLNEYVKL